jgi:hypothetical protein
MGVMTSEPQDQDQPADAPREEPTVKPSSEAQSVRVRSTPAPPHKPTTPVTGVTARSNTADAWDQIRQTAESTTQKLNDFRHRNQGTSNLEKTARQVAERGREETGKGLRALAEGQHAEEPHVTEPPKPDGRP